MLQIRRYRESDKKGVWELHKIALEPTGALLGNGPWNEDLNNIQRHYLDNQGEFLVGVLDNKIVCMGAFRRKSSSLAEIKRMRVHPTYQRKGFGQMILSKLEEKASAMGYNELCLDTTTKQNAAQNLYEKNGYHEIRRGSFAGLEVIFYEKKLISRCQVQIFKLLRFKQKLGMFNEPVIWSWIQKRAIVKLEGMNCPYSVLP